MKPQNIEEFPIPVQSPKGPDFSLLENEVDKSFNKDLTPNVAPNPIPNEILYMRDLGNRISSLRDRAVDVAAERDANIRSSVTALVAAAFDKLLGRPAKPEVPPSARRDNLMNRESLIANDKDSKIFKDPASRNTVRRFFYDDAHQQQAWFFIETTPQTDGHVHYDKDMRYEIHDNGVLEVARVEDNQNPQGYHYAWQYIDADEYNNLRIASELYYQQIVEKIYRPDYGITE